MNCPLKVQPNTCITQAISDGTHHRLQCSCTGRRCSRRNRLLCCQNELRVHRFKHSLLLRCCHMHCKCRRCASHGEKLLRVADELLARERVVECLGVRGAVQGKTASQQIADHL